MRILCHRGLWTEPGEQNTLAAFRTAWANGWGIETDVRDHDGVPVISHDPPSQPVLTLDELLTAWDVDGNGTPLALNIKADGLASSVRRVAAGHAGAGTSSFAFDMSVPDLLAWAGDEDTGVPAWTRWSDLEPDPVLLDRTAGVWLDFFSDERWWGHEELALLRAAGRPAVIVSAELHRRPERSHWEWLGSLDLVDSCGLSICTDFPEAAARVFA